MITEFDFNPAGNSPVSTQTFHPWFSSLSLFVYKGMNSGRMPFSSQCRIATLRSAPNLGLPA